MSFDVSFAQGVYAGVLASSLLLIIGVAASGRRTPSTRLVDAPTQDPWEIAFLAGGPARVADAAIATLHEDGRLAIGGPGVVTVRQAVARDPVEQAVLDTLARTPGGALATLRAGLMRSPAVQEIGDRLEVRGLMRNPRRARVWRRLAGAQMTACVAVLFLSVLLTLSGAIEEAFDEPPTFFTIAPAVFVGVAVGSVCKRTAGRRVTKAGSFTLHTARVAHASGALGAALRPAGLVVALGGTALLTDEILRQQLAEAQRVTASGSATSSGGSSGNDSGWSSPGDGTASWCGSSDGGSGCGSSSSGGGSSCGGGSSSCGGSSSGGSSCGGGGCGS
ncbi:TIGR04222 domain-containing membrane protein [Streptomyces sp. NPDC017993]|uniref:TIGR04222 domain-containing membrane protein n=1 Tax=Streptomyces sp. NPDC017993 TaxID=3365027 RepID=UPI003793ACC0